MKIKDEKRWTAWKTINQDDGYSAAVVAFAEHWAERMERSLAIPGVTVATCADADGGAAARDHGITGYQYHAALMQLILCWEHGEDLRAWWNAANPLSPFPDWAGLGLKADTPEATWAVVRFVGAAADPFWVVHPSHGVSYWPTEALARSYASSAKGDDQRVPLALEGFPRDDDSLIERARDVVRAADSSPAPSGVVK